MPLRSFTTSAEGSALAGVCAGIAQALGVDATLVRLIFALLALAGGAGIVLYLALWAWSSEERPRWALLLVLVAGSALLGALGVSDRGVLGIALVAAGLALALRQGGRFRPDAPLSYGGIALAGAGTIRCRRAEARPRSCSPRARWPAPSCSCAVRCSGGSRSNAMPSAPRASARTSAPMSPSVSTTRCCRRSR